MGVVALHHTRKMDADDPVDTISGSLGLAGAADAPILARGSKGTTLYVRGRDVEESEQAITFGSETCRWTLLGDAGQVYRSDTKTAILTVLEKATGLLGPAEIGSVAELPRGTVDTALHRMAVDGTGDVHQRLGQRPPRFDVCMAKALGQPRLRSDWGSVERAFIGS